MFGKANTRIERSFTMSIGELIFQVHSDKLLIVDHKGGVLQTPITSDEMQTLSEFCEKSKDILQPIPGNTIVYINDSGPQKITLMKDEKDNYLLLLNQQLQFTTQSEEIYHEALVGPAVCAIKHYPKSFLILGGGDGLVAKQIFKENPNARVTLVDFDRKSVV